MVLSFSEREGLRRSSYRGWVWKLMFGQSEFKVVSRHLSTSVWWLAIWLKVEIKDGVIGLGVKSLEKALTPVRLDELRLRGEIQRARRSRAKLGGSLTQICQCMRRLQRHWGGAVTEGGGNPGVEPQEPGEDDPSRKTSKSPPAALLRCLIQEELSINCWV